MKSFRRGLGLGGLYKVTSAYQQYNLYSLHDEYFYVMC